MGSVAVSGSQSKTRASRPCMGSQSVPTIDCTSSGSLDWMASNLMQFTLNTPLVVPTNNMLLCSTDAKKIPVSHRCCDLRVHDCLSEWWQFLSTWFSPANFMRRLVVLGCSVGSVQKLCCVLNCVDSHCVGQRKLHPVVLRTCMAQCSRSALNLPDRSLYTCIVLRFHSVTIFEDWSNRFSHV